MKIQLTFKTPDVIDYAIEDLSEDEKEIAKTACEKWVEYGECINVTIDTDTETCIVNPV
jgi:hypothetical protein